MVTEAQKIIASLVGLIVGIVIFLASSPPWTTPGSATAYYSVLAFLTITITVCASNRSRTDPSVANSIFTAGNLYASIIFGGAAIFYVFNISEPATHAASSGIFLNLVAFGTTGVLMLLSSYFGRNPPSEESLWNNRFLPNGVVVTGVLTFAVSLMFARTSESPTFFVFCGYVLGVVSAVCYLLASYIEYTSRMTTELKHEPLRLTIAFLVLALASLVHMSLLQSPNALWLVSISLMAVAFIYAIVATGYAYMIDIGVERGNADGIAASISMVVVLPFLATQLGESLFADLPFPEIDLSAWIHLGGCIFAGCLAFALYYRSLNQEGSYLLPIYTLLFLWAVAEVGILYSHVVPLYGSVSETRIPYIASSIISIPLLLSAIRRILKPSDDEEKLSPKGFVAIYGVAFVAMIQFGEALQASLFHEYPLVFTGQFGTALMLGLSYVSLFLLLYFFLLLASYSGGAITFDSLATGSLTLWLVIVILKGNFSVWTMGYWAAEVLLAFTVAVFPIGLMRFYLAEDRRNQLRQYDALISSKFLIDRIMQHHAKAIDVLDLMLKTGASEQRQLDSISMVLQEVARGEDLAKNMRPVLVQDKVAEDALEPVDLVDVLIESLEASQVFVDPPSQIKTNRERGACYVTGNSLLNDVFEMLLKGVLQRIGRIQFAEIQLSQANSDLWSTWHTALTLEIFATEATKMRSLFERYTKGYWAVIPEFGFAKRFITLFRGTIQAESLVGSQTQVFLVFRIALPAAPAI
jgi:hypothetical protein